MLIREC